MDHRALIMKRVTIFLAMLAVIGTAAVLWQRLSATNLHRQTEAASAANSEFNTASSAATNSELEREAAALRARTRDLAKLRNEVSQLRTKQGELAAARAENERLLQAKQTRAAAPREAPPGFVAKEQLRNAGYETPEDAIQTFFWAMREGSLELAMQSFAPGQWDRIQFEKLSAEKRAQEEEKFKRDEKRAMEHFNDFSVARKEQTSEDTVVLHVHSSISTNTAKFQLKRFGSEWKLSEF
jgi:hypothetical protein